MTNTTLQSDEPQPLISDLTKTPQELSDEFKSRGNEHFKLNKFSAAIKCYDEAISLYPTAILFANRAFCEIRLENFGTAIENATNAIELDPTYAKGYYRRGSAYLHLKNFNAAKLDLKKQCELTPNSVEARKRYTLAIKLEKEQKFMASIALPPEEESKDIEKEQSETVIPPSYTGPMFTFPITPENCPIELITTEAANLLRECKVLPLKFVIALLVQIKKILGEEPNMITVPLTKKGVTVVGDTHGQFYDLLHIFEQNGYPSEDNVYIFNGDYVDRGSFSVEVILLLFLLKARYPQHLILLRGNHETNNMNELYGFKIEVADKYNSRLFPLFSNVFNHLPICALITDEKEIELEDALSLDSDPSKSAKPTRVFCVHGGLPSTDGVKLAELQLFNRKMQPPEDKASIYSELLWTDPQIQKGRSPSPRGVSLMYGPDVSKAFCEDNNLSYILRSHQMVDNGYEVLHEGRVVTVFSSPNYCDFQGNKGAICRVKPARLVGKETKEEKEAEEAKRKEDNKYKLSPPIEWKPVHVNPGLEVAQFSMVPHPPVPPMKYVSPVLKYGL